MEITSLKEMHYASVVNIYLEGIATGHATFQTEAPVWNDWNKAHLQHSRFIAVDNDVILGWAALTPVSSRCVYAGVAEVSVYVSTKHHGKGIGDLLMQKLVADSEANNIWTLQSGIFPENKASVGLHVKHGFHIIGKREKIGKMNDTWRDTVIMERRSKVTGIN